MTTTELPPLVAVTDETTDRAGWMQARSSRVTASIAHSIAVGGRSTWQRILTDMLNGETFTGNATTNRGRKREAFLLDYAQTFIDPSIEGNSRLFASLEDDRLGATPDGLGELRGKWERVTVEAKSHEFGWDDADGIPADHYDQVQFAIFVTDAQGGLYIWETMGEDGEPTLDEPRYLLVERDERRIAFLVREATRFLAWRDAGAPATDDLAPELDDALAKWADARARKQAAESDEKTAEAVIRAHIAATPNAETDGVKLAGRAASFVYSVKDDDVLDEDAWAEAEPGTHSQWGYLKERANTTAEHALALYNKPLHKSTLRITATKETA
jgi:hypothetical protein